MNVVVINHLSLDGVMQAPARADEDTRGGFKHGGWSMPNGDTVMGEAMSARMAQGDGLLLGRRTYEDLLSHWNAHPDGLFTDALNNAPKYVGSSTLTEPLPWPNSTLLQGDIAGAVGGLQAQPGRDLVILGSGALITSLMGHDLIDEYLLMIHPVVLGSGRRLFAHGGPSTSLRLVDSTRTTTGVVIATYRPVGRASS